MARRRRTTISRHIVLDASVMRAAGIRGASDPRSSGCREFLMAIRRIGHRVVLGPEIRVEWDKHQSRFAMDWRVSMAKIPKIDLAEIGAVEELRDRVRESAPSAAVARILLKDLRLIEAALASDRIIASLDDAARGHFARCCPKVPELTSIVWVNPGTADEGLVEWLEGGARDEPRRRLGSFGG